ncbi:MAG: lactoylglutathione lyase [Bacteroidetes bacterium]|nr:lactoylglutathione lyase [Bacteroidota bacterium]
MKSEFILYVKDQKKSRDFYIRVMNIKPTLDVPGMTEFTLSENVKLGLMPESGIRKILGTTTPDPASGNGIPRCELYLKLENPESYFQRAISAGAIPVSPFQQRDWGDSAGYVADPDGHILCFATG